MNQTEILAVIVTIVFGAAFILSCYCVHAAHWWFCNRCLRYHNNVGEVHPGVPQTGHIAHVSRPCAECAKKEIL